jgi:hypothetical protein
MDKQELLDRLLDDLGNISASRKAHQQIIQILQSYKQQIEQQENKEDE